MSELSAIILVGGKGTRLKGLTSTKSKSYVSIYGKFRIIDFPLSALSYSDIRSVGIITQYEPYDLMRYIGSGASWDLDDESKGIAFLTPYENKNSELSVQKGTANALLSQINYIKKIDTEYVLVLSGDQIYNIDFNDCLKFHKLKNSKLTILSKKIDDINELKRFGVIETDNKSRIISFSEKPENPKSNSISLGMYLFNKDFLIEQLFKADKLIDFGRDLIPYIVEKYDDIYSYNYDGHFSDVGTIESLYKENMFFLDNPNLLNQKGNNYKIYSKPLNYKPQFIKDGSLIINSVISDGVTLDAYVNHSILSYGVTINNGSKITDSIILPNTTIGSNSEIKNAIIDEDLVIKDNTKLLFDDITLVDKEYLRRLYD